MKIERNAYMQQLIDSKDNGLMGIYEFLSDKKLLDE